MHSLPPQPCTKGLSRPEDASTMHDPDGPSA